MREMNGTLVQERKQLVTLLTHMNKLDSFTEKEKILVHQLYMQLSINNESMERKLNTIMTEQQFWDIVKECEWGKDFDYKRIHDFLINKYNQKEMYDFDGIFDNKRARLAKAVDRYTENKYNHDLPYGGDDSFGDMLCHVIGLGKEYYEKAVENPSTLVGLKVKESFSYAIPYQSDYEKLKNASE